MSPSSFYASSWQQTASSKRAARDALIPPAWRLQSAYFPSPSPDKTSQDLDVTAIPEKCGILDELDIEITGSDARTILERVHAGRWKAVKVTEAFCKRAAIAQQLVNCLTEIHFAQALKRAQELDDIFASNGGKPVGPLHGLPISIKDNFLIKGLDSTLGFICWANKPVEEDSVLISILREAGAVLYCKTNVPTAMMIGETYNNVWGRTLNPYSRILSPGGSSGGEAALLALKGSPLGVGTDIGGSIRIPATCCGLYSLRPSFGRFPTYGARSGMAGQEAVNSVNGPLARSLASLTLFASTVVGAEPWLRDPKALPIPWRSISLPQKLTFGFFCHDGLVRPNPPVERAVDVTIQALRDAGHEVFEWKPYQHARGASLLKRMFLADGGRSIQGLISASGEDWPKGLAHYRDASSKPEADRSTHDMWQVQAERNKWAKEYLDLWMATAHREGGAGSVMDAIICPTSPFPAMLHDKSQHVAYTGVWNVLDYSAGTVPVLRADPALDERDESYKPLNAVDEQVWKQYDAQAYAGGPVSVQVVGKRLEEEKVLAMCAVVDEALDKAGWGARKRLS